MRLSTPPIRPPHAGRTAPPRPKRPAVTLLEVLVSMGVMTLGILGVAAMFPIGSHYAQRADLYDRADAAASAAFNDAVVRGLLDPDNWVSYETGVTVGPYNPTATRVTGEFTRPFAQDMQYRLSLGQAGLAPVDQQIHLAQECGTFYVVDPLGVATGYNGVSGDLFEAPAALRGVPASHTSGITQLDAGQSPWWGPWSNIPAALRVSVARPPLVAGGRTYQHPPVSATTAERLASTQDDLALDLGDQADQPSQQQVLASNINGVQVPLQRQVNGHYSYLVTVVPRTHQARDALAFGGRGMAYDVSAVVFYRRPQNRFDPTADYGGIETTVRAERMCRASVRSSAPSGGEVRLVLNTDQADDALPATPTEGKLPWSNLREGQYVMLMGPAPHSTAVRPMMFAQWYRVTALGDEPLATSGATYLGPTLALRGPDWPWAASGLIADPANNTSVGDYASTPGNVSDDLRVLILDGVSAVHTRTLRLDDGAVW